MIERKTAGADEASELEAFANAISDTYFRLREFGERIGLTHEYGSNVSTVLSMLLDREMTVSEVAKIRGVSRQFAIKLARQLEADGIIRLSSRPGSRGYFMQLTPKGVAQVRARSALFRKELAGRSKGLDVATVRLAEEALVDFRHRLGQ